MDMLFKGVIFIHCASLLPFEDAKWGQELAEVHKVDWIHTHVSTHSWNSTLIKNPVLFFKAYANKENGKKSEQ